MENQAGNNQGENGGSGYKSFAAKRIILAAVLIVVVVWALGLGLNIFERSPKPTTRDRSLQHTTAGTTATHAGIQPATETSQNHSAAHETQIHSHETAAVSQPESASSAMGSSDESHTQPIPSGTEPHGSAEHSIATPVPSHEQAVETKKTPTEATGHEQESEAAGHEQQAEAPSHERPTEAQPHEAEVPSHEAPRPTGVAFVEAVIKPMDYELNKRFWGWRPNDIINFTDNTNNFQLGVLEVTRRSTVMLTDRISRTGSTDRLDPHLEDASNWLMVTATRYWFPSPESKYKECIKELEAYKEELIKGNASFYIRADSLIPLLASYEDLLGSCDENLVKQKNADGSKVSFFKADDYFFYAKGVASAMATILEAMHHDFLPTLENRHGTELLHHAELSCRQAAALCPLFITNTDLDGIFANHRANMAAPISHARYYIGQLIKTLST